MINRLKELYLKYKEIINYLIVGGLTTVVSLVTYYACVLTFLDPNNPLQLQIANVISWIFAVAFAYVTNRKYVFLPMSPTGSTSLKARTGISSRKRWRSSVHVSPHCSWIWGAWPFSSR